MRRKNMDKKRVLIILSVMLAVIVVGLCVQAYTEKEVSVKLLVSMVLIIAAIIRVAMGNTSETFRKREVYASTYKDEIRKAFSFPSDKKYYNRLMRAIDLYNQNKFKAAINELFSLLKVCRSKDDFVAVLMFIALSYEEAGMRDRAIDAYCELLKYDSEYSTAWSNMGLLYRKEGKHRDAIGCYLNAIKYDEHNAYAYNNLASSLFAIGDYHSAIEHAKTSLDKKKDLYQAANTLAASYLLLGNKEESEKYYNIAITNGASKEKLDETLKKLSQNNVYVENIMPIPEEVQRACAAFSRSTAVPFVQMCLPMEDGVKSHVGGSLGEAPFDSKGMPMKLLCAIYCEEINCVPDFPKSGVLRFYIADNPTLGIDRNAPTVQKDFRVIYSENGFLYEKPVISVSEDFPVKEKYGVIFQPSFCPVTYSDYRFEGEFSKYLEQFGASGFSELGDDVHFQLAKDYTGAGHRVGGYPHFCAEDPRKNNVDLRKYDTLLLQVVSHGEYVNIFNDGVISFLIPHEKLVARDFSDIMYWWDEEASV